MKIINVKPRTAVIGIILCLLAFLGLDVVHRATPYWFPRIIPTIADILVAIVFVYCLVICAIYSIKKHKNLVPPKVGVILCPILFILSLIVEFAVRPDPAVGIIISVLTFFFFVLFIHCLIQCCKNEYLAFGITGIIAYVLMLVSVLGAFTFVLTERNAPTFVVLLSLFFITAFVYCVYLCIWDKGKVGRALTICLTIIPVAISVVAIMSYASVIKFYIIAMPGYLILAIFHLPLVLGIKLCVKRNESGLISLMISLTIVLFFLINVLCYTSHNFLG